MIAATQRLAASSVQPKIARGAMDWRDPVFKALRKSSPARDRSFQQSVPSDPSTKGGEIILRESNTQVRFHTAKVTGGSKQLRHSLLIWPQKPTCIGSCSPDEYQPSRWLRAVKCHSAGANALMKYWSGYFLQYLNQPFWHVEHHIVAARNLVRAPALLPRTRQAGVKIRNRDAGRPNVGLLGDTLAHTG